MLKNILTAYRLFAQKSPKWFLMILPLLIYSVAEAYADTVWKGILATGVLFVFSILINIFTEIALYKYFLKAKSCNPFRSAMVFLKYMIAQFLFGIIIIVPMIIFKIGAVKLGFSPLSSLFIAFMLNIFTGFYLWARLNIALPLIVSEKNINLQEIWKNSRHNYISWLSVVICVFLPYMLVNFFINCQYLNAGLLPLFMVLIIAFNSNLMLTTEPKAKKKKAE